MSGIGADMDPEVLARPTRGRERHSGPIPPRQQPKRRRSKRVWIAGGVVVIALGYLVWEGLGNALNYYQPVNVALADRAKLGQSEFRLEGMVVRGSVRQVPGGVAFELAAGGKSIEVRNSGAAPEMFAPGISVVVVGHLAPGRLLFVSDQIMVKHSANYVPDTKHAGPQLAVAGRSG